ncbi:MAG: hypothetical protein CBE26_02130 [Kiritimatiellaceae bacterium TMED266]|nr:MAG: hypothetical protein CBE26_02130 [Kiritimatiellaceae bacterium TMED266]|tara:strand:- start:727 stop:1335 length:609 start_codon:yes stop_codon:yes gene_type:complete
MEIRSTQRMGRLGHPVHEIYNQAGEKIYEAHDELACEFWSPHLLETIENHSQLNAGDIEEVSEILRQSWLIWGNIDDENRIYNPDKFQHFIHTFHQQEPEDRYLIIQEIVSLLGKGVNRYGEKMRAMNDLLNEKWDELILFQGRGKPNADSLKKGKKHLENGLASFCKNKGLSNENETQLRAIQEIFQAALQEEHMIVFTQI